MTSAQLLFRSGINVKDHQIDLMQRLQFPLNHQQMLEYKRECEFSMYALATSGYLGYVKAGQKTNHRCH